MEWASEGRRGTAMEWEWESRLRKYLLVLATLVVTVTYSAGFTPPGGIWEEKDTAGSYLAGDPILWHTSKLSYVVFFYSNATAFASSLGVAVLFVILPFVGPSERKPLRVLRGFMVLDLLSLMVAYTAGIYRDRYVPVYTMVLAALTVVYVIVFHMVLPRCHPGRQQDADHSEKERKELEKPRKMLMLLATFAVSITYLAGLSMPGGFRDNGGGAGDPVLMGGRHERRLKAFIYLNSTAFFCSLLITVQLLDKKLQTRDKQSFRFRLLYASIVLALLGLVGAYSTGSSRNRDATIYLTLVGGAVPACILLLRVMILLYSQKVTSSAGQEGNDDAAAPTTPRLQILTYQADLHPREQLVEKPQSFVLLFSTLVATITYQAGLDPPGGLWEKDGIGYKTGDPILLTTNPRRFKTFFYFNSVAFMSSLLSIIVIKQRLPDKYRFMERIMLVELFGLIGAYAAGSCREISTSIYVMSLGGAILVYVVLHIVFFTLDHMDSNTRGNEDVEQKAILLLEKKRKRLILFAILAASITYQVGLTPPGGFRLQNDSFGHLAGSPVLLYNFPRRYTAFFYCNSVSFMHSITMFILLINPNLYRLAIRSNAPIVCTVAGMLTLLGAYAVGSTQHMSTSVIILGLAAAILTFVVAPVLIFAIHPRSIDISAIRPCETTPIETIDMEEKKLYSEQKCLVLLGILAASVTYQAGLKPPGGVWKDDDLQGHVAGNPAMHDNRRTRYLAFFYTNSTSFVASVIVIILLLLKPLQKGKLWSIKAMNTMIVLDLVGLLVAYAVGSSRSWKATGYVFVYFVSVLVYIVLHIMLEQIVLAPRTNNKEENVGAASISIQLPQEANGDQEH